MRTKTVKVIGYTLDADYWCPPCVRDAWQAGEFTSENPNDLDEHGIPYDLVGREKNTAGAVFNDRSEREEYCGNCGEELIEREKEMETPYG